MVDQAAAVVGTASVTPDDALVEAARRDPQAFEALYLRYRASVFRYLRTRVGDDDMAADLTATTFERALAAIGRYRPSGGGVPAWLLRIARNAAIDAGRRARRAPTADLVDVASAADPEADALWADEAARLRALVAGLPEPQREAIALRYAARLSAREIGVVIGRSEAATQKLLTRALAVLKEAYGDPD